MGAGDNLSGPSQNRKFFYLVKHHIEIMTEGSRNIGTQILVGVVVIVAASLVVELINAPQIIPVEDNYGNIVPETITFNTNGEVSDGFSLMLRNTGDDDGNIYVKIRSDEILSRTDNRENFETTSEKIYFVERKQNARFNFDLKLNENAENIDNFTITVTCGWTKIMNGKTLNSHDTGTQVFMYKKVSNSWERNSKYVLS
ncbi:hypothetical protein [Methanosarcina sp. MTP4]|uniref:hypothetical protein n=1 Tax=Methanosarcina sp. MTP4 TaxID=1434100 RepID=UPI0018CE354B|nr:hypothetical protein [Methanosarcina sp. MTP4]